ncbi:MAG: FAD-binding protein [Acidimicrobiia bacterium]|nr:FAD-binding protein [Acidimicrobiia bacterium]
MTDITSQLEGIVGAANVLTGSAIAANYQRDEALTAESAVPAYVVHPRSTEEVSALLRLADTERIPVTARGSGTGLSGAAVPTPGGMVVCFEHMNRVLEIDTDNYVAVVQPGVTLDALDTELEPQHLVYPVYPGEYSASIGGNVNTNAGGMRAVKYGVTRHQVLGLEAVLASGDVIRTGGKYVKATSGYDLTQLVIGSEGTLALVTEATLRLHPRYPAQATILAPFPTLQGVTGAIPRIVGAGVEPLILEYIDMLTMAALRATLGLELGIPDDVKQEALAYLVVMLEDTHESRLEEDVGELAGLLGNLGAIDVYVLPPKAAQDLIDAREKAFWVAKGANADDIVDIVVPRAAIPEYMAKVAELQQRYETLIAGCGHAGDGNVHLSVFQPDADKRHKVMREMFEIGLDLGGAISAEHGIGTEKKRYFAELEDPVKIELLRGIKRTFDPHGILNPGTVFD